MKLLLILIFKRNFFINCVKLLSIIMYVCIFYVQICHQNSLIIILITIWMCSYIVLLLVNSFCMITTCNKYNMQAIHAFL